MLYWFSSFQLNLNLKNKVQLVPLYVLEEDLTIITTRKSTERNILSLTKIHGLFFKMAYTLYY